MFDILEAEQGKPFKVRGIFMKKNSLSRNGRYYSDKIVESTVESMSNIIEGKGSYPISMMADHPGVASNKTLSTIGKITNVFLDGDNAVLEAEIANTSLGKDVQELIRGGFVEGLSIRATNGKFKKRYIDDKLVNDVLEMEIKGVDLVVNPGVDGMKITDIIESDQSNSNNIYISINEEEEIKPQDIVNEEEIMNLQELKEKYPNLVTELKDEHKKLFESEFKVVELTESVNTLTDNVNTLTESEKALQVQVTERDETIKMLQESETDLKTKLDEAEGKLKTIEESEAKAKRDAYIATKLGELKFADSVKNGLKAKLDVLESIEQIDSVLETEVNFLNMVIQESTGINLGKGHTGENGETTVNEDEEFVNKVLGM